MLTRIYYYIEKENFRIPVFQFKFKNNYLIKYKIKIIIQSYKIFNKKKLKYQFKFRNKT